MGEPAVVATTTAVKDGLFIFNASLFTAKLDATNHSQWRDEILDLLFGLELIQFVDGSTEPPTLPESGATGAQKKDHLKWQRQDRLLKHALASSISPAIRPSITSAKTSRDVWKMLEDINSASTRPRVMSLKESLLSATQEIRRSLNFFMELVSSQRN